MLRVRRRSLLELDDGAKEFWLNKRDAPLIPLPSVELDVRRLGPCLSQYTWTNPATALIEGGDLCIPCAVDYQDVSDGMRFGAGPVCASSAKYDTVPKWRDRCPRAIWRGGATGWGTTPDTNVRLRLVQLSVSESLKGSERLLDARLTSWNPRLKISPDDVVRVLDRADASYWGLDPNENLRANFLTIPQQARCKFTVYLDGNVGASRIGALLRAGFVILAPPIEGPAARLRWLLVPDEHFVQIEPDLSDLLDAIRKLRQNDAFAEKISQNARELWRREAGSTESLERAVKEIFEAIPPPCGNRFENTLDYVWTETRSAIYVLVDGLGRVRIFAPITNPEFVNAWSQRLTFDPPFPEFETRALRAIGEVVRPREARTWWRNAGLLCTQAHRMIWGEDMVAVFHALLERSLASDEESVAGPSTTAVS
jgi:hypothetical protein